MAKGYPTLTDSEQQALYEQFLRCIDREENLIHYRMTWGLNVNIAFVAAVIACFNIDDLAIRSAYHITVFLAVFGALFSVVSFVGVQAAHKQTRYLIGDVERRLDLHSDDWNKTGFLRPYGDPRSVHPHARVVSTTFPLICALLWLLVGCWMLGQLLTPGAAPAASVEVAAATRPATSPVASAPITPPPASPASPPR
jgi:membrane associated rhomboid family serine protease